MAIKYSILHEQLKSWCVIFVLDKFQSRPEQCVWLQKAWMWQWMECEPTLLPGCRLKDREGNSKESWGIRASTHWGIPLFCPHLGITLPSEPSDGSVPIPEQPLPAGQKEQVVWNMCACQHFNGLSVFVCELSLVIHFVFIVFNWLVGEINSSWGRSSRDGIWVPTQKREIWVYSVAQTTVTNIVQFPCPLTTSRASVALLRLYYMKGHWKIAVKWGIN